MTDVIKQTVDALRPDIEVAVRQGVRNSVGIDVGDVERIIDETTRDAAAVIVNQMNQEPWYKSTVTVTALGSFVIATYALGYDFLDGSIPTPAEFAPLAGAVILPLGTLWGRWMQKKPIGE